MYEDFERKFNELRKNNEPFATAIVVRREAPSSGKAGDKAVITRFGEVFGWIGGGCTKGIIIKEAGIAMTNGQPRFIRISPEPNTKPTKGMKEYQMTCHSGGSVDVFIEPNLAKPHLVVIGNSAIARALIKIAKTVNYHATAMASDAQKENFPDADEIINKIDLSDNKFTANTFLVVATQGEQDEIALMEALKKDFSYIAFVASSKKRIKIFDYLRAEGFTDETLSKIKSPAGLNINAKTPEEVAISILAEIIQNSRTKSNLNKFLLLEKPLTAPNLYINPVCNIPVDKATAKYVLDYKDEKVYFCCDGCKEKFEAEPEKYMSV